MISRAGEARRPELKGSGGGETTGEAQWTYVLSADEKAAVQSAAERLLECRTHDSQAIDQLEARLIADELPRGLRQRVLAFRRYGSDSGGLLLKNLPIGDVPATPGKAGNVSACQLFSGHVLSLIARILGEQYGFRPESGGALIQNIVPERGNENEQHSVSSKARLLDHVEMAFTPFRPDFIGLFCVRADHQGIACTTLGAAREVLARLGTDVLEVLRQPLYRTTMDSSFLIGLGRTEDIWVGPIAVLEGSEERPALRVDFAETEGLTAEAQHALDKLAEAAYAVRRDVPLEAGDLVWIANRSTIHGRTEFQPRWDGNDRWLLRTFVTNALDASAAVRPGDGLVLEMDYSI